MADARADRRRGLRGCSRWSFVFTPEGRNHLLRAYLMGFMTCFNFAGGGLAMLMLQYVSGGKWGLLLRRPLEAMTRTLPLVALMFLPIAAVLGKHLYQWVRVSRTRRRRSMRIANGLMTQGAGADGELQAHDAEPGARDRRSTCIDLCGAAELHVPAEPAGRCERDADPQRGTEPSFERWRIKFENLSGPAS